MGIGFHLCASFHSGFEELNSSKFLSAYLQVFEIHPPRRQQVGPGLPNQG
jgi:hypothetical protein